MSSEGLAVFVQGAFVMSIFVIGIGMGNMKELIINNTTEFLFQANSTIEGISGVKKYLSFMNVDIMDYLGSVK